MKFRRFHVDGDGNNIWIAGDAPLWFGRLIFGKAKLEELRRRAQVAPDATLEIPLPFGLGTFGVRWPRATRAR